ARKTIRGRYGEQNRRGRSVGPRRSAWARGFAALPTLRQGREAMTRKACVIGWPVKHSRSPTIHRFWLKELGLDGDYVIQPVEPERIADFFRDFADSGYVGC